MLYSKLSKLEKDHFNKYPISKSLKDQVKQNKLNVFLKTNGYNLYDSKGQIIYQVSLLDNGSINVKIGVENESGNVSVISNKYVDFSNASNIIHYLNGLKNTLDLNKKYYLNLFNKFTVSGKIDNIIEKIKNNMNKIIEEYNKLVENNLDKKSNDIEKANEYIKQKMKEYNITNVNNEIVSLQNDLKNKLINYEEFKLKFDSEILTKFQISREELNKCSRYINRLKNDKIYSFKTENDNEYIYKLLGKVKNNEINYEKFVKQMERVIRLWQSRQLLSKYYKNDNEFPEEIKELVDDYVKEDLNREEFVEELIRCLKRLKLD